MGYSYDLLLTPSTFFIFNGRRDCIWIFKSEIESSSQLSSLEGQKGKTKDSADSSGKENGLKSLVSKEKQTILPSKEIFIWLFT